MDSPFPEQTQKKCTAILILQLVHVGFGRYWSCGFALGQHTLARTRSQGLCDPGGDVAVMRRYVAYDGVDSLMMISRGVGGSMRRPVNGMDIGPQLPMPTMCIVLHKAEKNEPIAPLDWYATEVRCRADLDCQSQWLRIILERPAERPAPASPALYHPTRSKIRSAGWIKRHESG
jgi:hypothetical protein